MPNDAQLRGLYRLSYWLTYIMLQPIHLVCIDDRTSKRTVYLDFSALSDEDLVLNAEELFL